MQIPSRIATIAGSLFFLIVFISSWFSAVPLFPGVLETVIVWLAGCGLMLLAAYLADRYLGRKSFLLLLIGVGLALRVGWILWFNTAPDSDFLTMYSAAMTAAGGDFSFTGTDYFSRFSYLLGSTMYEALIIKVFGNSLIILKLLNVLFSVGTAVLVYLAASRAFNEFCGRISSLVCILYIPNILMCSVLTNQHLSTFLFMLGCLLILDGWHLKRRWIWIGAAFGFGNMIRPLGIVYLLALAAFLLVILWQKRWKGINAKTLGKMAGVLVVFYLLQTVVSYSFIQTGISKTTMYSSQEPYWKFMVGLNAAANGGWNMDDAKYAVKYKLGEDRNRAELAKVKERLADPLVLMKLFAAKLVLMWGSADSSSYWSMQGSDKWELIKAFNQMERAMYLAICAYGFAALIFLSARKERSGFLLFVLLLLAYAAVHLLIEIQTRYRLDLIPAMILLQSYGVYRVYTVVQSYLPARRFNKSAEM